MSFYYDSEDEDEFSLSSEEETDGNNQNQTNDSYSGSTNSAGVNNTSSQQVTRSNSNTRAGYLQRLRNLFSGVGGTSTNTANTSSAPVNIAAMEPDRVNEFINDICENADGPVTRQRRRLLEEAVNPGGDNGGRPANQGSASRAAYSRSVPKRPWSASNGSSSGGTASSQPKARKYHHSGPSTTVNPRASRSGNIIPIRETISARRNLVAEQNRAYEESLKADKERERIKQEKEKAEEAKQEEIKKRKQLARELLPEEPKDNDDEVISIAFRLPSGATVRRNFHSTDSIFTLHQFVLSQDETPMRYDVIRHPNQRIPSEEQSLESGMTLREYGLTRKEVLHVRHRMASNVGFGDAK